ncbi:MAG: hypothetical protein ACE5LA_07870 [Dehalococcoidales bacterium]
MTDEELQKEIQQVSESLDKLYNSDKPLTKEEKKQKRILSVRKQMLNRIKKAREQNDRDRELAATIEYALMTSVGEKHPYLIPLIKSKFGWTVF